MPAPLDLIHQTTTDTGTGDFTLTSVNGKRDFSEFSGSFVYFASNRAAAEWEIGTTSLVSGLLDRTNATIINSSNIVSGVAELVNFSAGTKDVTNDVPASSQVYQTASTTVEGKVELATVAEAQARTDTARAVTPSGLADFARLATGSYTGDGTTSQAITGLGFQPKYLRIFNRFTVDTSSNLFITETSDTMNDDNANGMCYFLFDQTGSAELSTQDNRVSSLDADGFTVDDDGADREPNANGIVYNFVAIG